MVAGSRDDDRPLGRFLAADVGEIVVVFRELLKQLAEARGGGLDLQRAGEEADGLGQTSDGDGFDSKARLPDMW